jgi:hypothetical protein
MRKTMFWRLLIVLYGAAVLLLTVVLTARGSALARCEEKTLQIEDAWTDAILNDYEVDWIGFETGDLLAQSTDPMLVWTLNEEVSGLRLRIRTSQPVREMELYYTTQPGQDYAVERCLRPTVGDPLNGLYEFRFPKATYVHQLRLDPTGAAGSFMRFAELTLNPVRSTVQYYAPSAAQLLTVLSVPPLATLAVREVVNVLHPRSKEDE